MKWSVPKDLWAGETVAILASGPSMSQAIADKIEARGIPSIAINTTYQLAPWASMLYAADALWWTTYWRKLGDFKGLRVTCAPEAFPQLLALRVSGAAGFDEDTSSVRTGSNSGYQAIHVAMQAGAKRIELHGMNMSSLGGQQHWHGRHPGDLRNHGDGIYERWIDLFAQLVPAAKKKGVQIVNCTPRSAIKCFPFELDEKPEQ